MKTADIVPVRPQAVSPEALADLHRLEDVVRQLQDDAIARATRRAYMVIARSFSAWCREHGRSSAPAAVWQPPAEPEGYGTPGTLDVYCADLVERGAKLTAVRQYATVIDSLHKKAGFGPLVDVHFKETFSGLKRTYGMAVRKARPLFPEDLRKAYKKISKGMRRTRDIAIANLAFAGGFRESEVVGLNVDDVEFLDDRRMVVTLRRSKTDQAGVGYRKGIMAGQFEETCPVRTLRTWIAAAGIVEGPLFLALDRNENVRSGQRASVSVVYRLARRIAKKAGLNPTLYSGHSFRAGLVTAANRAGKQMDRIMNMTAHKSVQIAQGYIREDDLWRGNASEGIGL